MAIAIERVTATERSGAPAGDRTSGHGIVLAGDRTASRRLARRHSKIVRTAKFALPISAIIAFGLYGASVFSTSWSTAISELAVAQIIPENLAMENPHYEGFNADGGRYWVQADKAIQDLKSMGLIKLEGITGELMDAQKSKTRLKAARGEFDNKANLLELFDAIDIAGDNGLKARLTRATVKTKEGIITSDQPVSVAMPAGEITSNQMTIRQKVKEYTFVDNVKSKLKPKAGDAKPGETKAAGMTPFGSSDTPVEITAGRLDINDVTKTALFTGNVVATQDGGSMSAPELEVTYEGAAVPGAKPVEGAPAAAADTGGKLKSLIARSPVELRQATGEVVTGHTASFDAATEKAVVDGDVVMVQQPDKRAVGDRAEFDQAAGTVLLTGAVSLTQGQNEMRGRRLQFNRASGKMQLTSPGADGGNGRILAKFQQTGGNSADKDVEKPAETGKGIPFGATFKTTPGAPVNVEAARLDIDDTAKQAVFTGDVRAVQGEFVIRAAEMNATYSGSAGLDTAAPAAGAPKTAAAKGAAQLTHLKARTKVNITGNDGQNATGDWADFDPKTNMATLGGNVVLTQGKNVVRGTKLVIDMTTGESTIKTETGGGTAGGTAISSGEGGGQVTTSGRPSAVFYPSDLKAQKNAKQSKTSAGDGWQAREQP